MADSNKTTSLPSLSSSSSSSTEAAVDSIVARLLALRGSPPGTLASLAENEIRMLCTTVSYLVSYFS